MRKKSRRARFAGHLQGVSLARPSGSFASVASLERDNRDVSFSSNGKSYRRVVAPIETCQYVFDMETISFLTIALIKQPVVPALRVGFTLAVIMFVVAGVLIWRRRHEFFDRDPDVENDVPVVRHNREEVIIFVWSGLMLVLISILYQVWSA